FDLEESNPAMQKDLWELGKKYGVTEKDTFTKLAYKKNFKILFPLIYKSRNKAAIKKLRLKLKETKLDENERNFYNSMADYYSILFKDEEWIGNSFLLGSSYYIAQAKSQGRKIKGLINLDTVGFTSDKKNSQTYPKGMPVNLLKLISKPILKSIPFLSKIFKFSGVKDVTVGDYASLLVDINSTSEADFFIKNAKQVNLKVVAIYTGMNYDNIIIKMPDLLRADHAPFWRENIPAIFITDTANFRCPHYHTGSDTIEHVDFDFVKKIAQTCLLTLIAMAEENNIK
ncbi:MAG: M28 family peptidase, partial [Promethearchaeota archaeon]